MPRVSIAWLLVGAIAAPAGAQEESIHWAYAAFFGTGRYSLSGSTETVVLSLTPSWTWREPALDSEGERQIGYQFRMPVSIGATEFAMIDQLDDLDKLSLDSINAVSLVPGVEIEIPVGERWSFKPLAYLGIGGETDGGDRARIFRIGLRSRLGFVFGDTQMQLVNALERLGYSASGGASETLNMMQTGLDFSRPLVNSEIAGDTVELSWQVMYTSYLDSLGLDLRAASLKPASIGSEWEIGLAFGKRDGKLRFWRLQFDRFGLAYRFASDSRFSGVSLVFKSLFDR